MPVREGNMPVAVGAVAVLATQSTSTTYLGQLDCDSLYWIQDCLSTTSDNSAARLAAAASPYMSIAIHSTPNPDSLMFKPDDGTFIDSGLFSFANAAQASENELATQLFKIDAVANVLILPAFVTITKHPDHDWGSVADDVKSLLKEYMAR